MSRSERGQYMGEVVLPKMKALFQGFDAQHFAVVDCATCHGSGAGDRTFTMPNSSLARLPDDAAGFQALVREKPGWMKFMAEQVRPQMAALLGKEEIDMRNPKPDAFGCRNCHVLGSAPESAHTAAAVSDLFAAIKKQDAGHVEELIRTSPALVDATNEKGRSPVLVAMFLLRDSAGFHVPAENPTLQALLAHHPTLDRFLAAAFGDSSRVRAELAKDPGYVHAQHEIGWAPLHFAAFADNVDAARALIEAGADVNAVANNKILNSPLQVSTLTKAVDVARVLLSRGADVMHRQEGGVTALHEAVLSGSRDMVAALLDAGADPLAKTDDGKTPMDLAHARGDDSLAKLLAAPRTHR